MVRKTLTILVAFLTVGALAFAQDTIPATDIVPTTGAGNDDYAKNTTADSATVSQTVKLVLPQATALHLDVTDLSFDLTAMDGALWPNSAFDYNNEMLCVYGNSDEDVVYNGTNNDVFYNQPSQLPLGTYYAEGDSGFPAIKIVGGTGAVTAYPPIKIANNELVEGSKNYFVCYRTFMLQKFSNGDSWDLTVTRTDTGSDMAIERLYIQDNPCDTFGALTGLFRLEQDTTLHLVPSNNLSVGPTGAQAASNHALCGYKSWLDDLVVVAVVVDGEHSGTNTAELDYTLQTTSWGTTTTQ